MTTDSMFCGAFTALVTPFTSDGLAIDRARLTAAVSAQAAAGIDGVVPCGTTGETPTLSDAEYRDMVTQTVALARPLDLTVIAGAGSNCTAHAVELQRFVASVGADASLQVAPYYNRPSQEGLYRHFMTIADSGDLPIVLYNVPGRTGVTIEADTITRLAAHPNIQAIKDATGGLALAYATRRNTDLAMLSGDDPMTLPLAMIGGVGVVSVVSNVVPEPVAQLCHACSAGDWETAQSINARLVPLAQALLSLDSNPVPAKTALALLGRDSGVVRLPLAPATDAVRTAVQKLLDQYAESASHVHTAG